MRVGPSACAALQLLAYCPGLPTDVVAGLLRMRHTRSAAQLLLRLRTAGLVHFRPLRPGPLVGSRTLRLWTLTPAGRAFLDGHSATPPRQASGLLPSGRPCPRRQRPTPMLV